MTLRPRWIGYVLVALALLLLLGVLYENTHRKDVPLLFSPVVMLNSIWQNYEAQYIQASDHRTLDRSRANVTTSEGESYTMLRAVWLGDKTTFDQADTWTKDNLQHSTDHLFSWLFGARPDGSYGILTAQGGASSASDADTDIALSLVFAYSRWQDPQYLGDARDIMRDIWTHEVITINGTPYLTADNYENQSSSTVAILNPSYFSPYAYRIFAEVDPAHPWNKLIDSSYAVLQQSLDMNLDNASTAKLPPDWITINKTTGVLAAPAASQKSNSEATSSALTTDFGYDALRVPFRLALDYTWYKDPRDKTLLDQMSFLSKAYSSSGELASTYTHSGTVPVKSDYESPAMYGATIGYFMVSDPKLAPMVYQDKLLYLYDPNTNTWKELLSYYDDNWAWFGLALYNHLLPNLSASTPANVLSTQ